MGSESLSVVKRRGTLYEISHKPHLSVFAGRDGCFWFVWLLRGRDLLTKLTCRKCRLQPTSTRLIGVLAFSPAIASVPLINACVRSVQPLCSWQ